MATLTKLSYKHLFFGIAVFSITALLLVAAAAVSTRKPEAAAKKMSGVALEEPHEETLVEPEIVEEFEISVPTDWELYEDQQFGFGIAHPPNWSVTKRPRSDIEGLPPTLVASYTVDPPTGQLRTGGDMAVGVILYHESLVDSVGRSARSPDPSVLRTDVYNEQISVNGLPGRLLGSYNRIVMQRSGWFPEPTSWDFHVRGSDWIAVVSASTRFEESFGIATSFSEL